MRNPDKTIEVAVSMQLSELIEEITSSPEEIFRIVVPLGARVLRSEVGLKLLKEKTHQQNKKLVFMTDDEVGKILLARSGFIVKPITKKRPENDYFESLASGRGASGSRMSDIKTVKQHTTDISSPRKPKEPEKKKTDKATGISRLRTFIPVRRAPLKIEEQKKTEEQSVETQPYIMEEISRDGVATRRPIFLYIAVFVVAAALIVFLVSFFILPSAKIEITPKRTVQAVSASVIIAPSVKEVSKTTNELPGQFLRLERDFSMTFKSSGKKYVEAPSTGIVRVFNEYSSSPQRLVVNTRFLSSEGRLFRTTQDVTVPGARIEEGRIIPNSIEVEVRADEAGDRYNIGPSEFTIPGFQGSPKFTAFYGRSERSMAGGFVGDADVVTDTDLANARRALEERVFGILEQEWPLRIPKDLTVLDEGKIKQVDDISFSAGIDAPVQTFQGTIKGSINLIAFRETDLQSLLQGHAETFTDANTKVESMEPFSFMNPQFNSSTQRFSVSVNTNAIIAARIEEEEIIEKVVGKSEAEIRSLLAGEPGIERAKITLWPFWSDSITDKPNKVRVDID